MQVKRFLRRILRKKYTYHYKRFYSSLVIKNGVQNKPIEGEKAWMKKWSVLGKADPIYYRLFSHYIGPNLNIISEDICRNIVEPILDPLKYVPYYSDKNIFDKLFKSGTLPSTILRKMNGFYYDTEYKQIFIQRDDELQYILQNCTLDKIVIKPTVESCSGNGVRLFQNRNGLWRDLESGDALTLAYLNTRYGSDFIIQDCLEQADYMSYFNSTSVNTLRLTLYRSVVTNECHVPSAIIRIGADGSLIDNAHAGGGCVGINVENGVLCKKVLNQYGECKTIFNGIDFSQHHQIPNWNKIVDFAKYIGSVIPHHRLLALDIMVDKTGEPKLIEFNCEAYSMWLFQFTMGPALGEYTDEIIEYCKNNIDKAQKIIKL